MVERADIFRRYGPESHAKFTAHMPPSHLKLMEAIAQGRTAALGGPVYPCTECGDLESSYHSCKNRHCPQCQHDEATRWLSQQRALLPAGPLFSCHLDTACGPAPCGSCAPAPPVQPAFPDLLGRFESPGPGPQIRGRTDRHDRG
jgi:Transposase zinc-binding domain